MALLGGNLTTKKAQKMMPSNGCVLKRGFSVFREPRNDLWMFEFGAFARRGMLISKCKFTMLRRVQQWLRRSANLSPGQSALGTFAGQPEFEARGYKLSKHFNMLKVNLFLIWSFTKPYKYSFLLVSRISVNMVETVVGSKDTDCPTTSWIIPCGLVRVFKYIVDFFFRGKMAATPGHRPANLQWEGWRRILSAACGLWPISRSKYFDWLT